MLRKITDLKQNEVIHCETLEQDKAIRELLHNAGRKCLNGASYMLVDYWEGYKRKGGICYDVGGGTHLGIETAKRHHYTIYPATDFLWQPKRGDLVEVSEDAENWLTEPMIYLCTIEGAIYPVQVVYNECKDDFMKGEQFDHTFYKHMRQYVKPKLKLTRSDIASKFGVDIDGFEIVEG